MPTMNVIPQQIAPHAVWERLGEDATPAFRALVEAFYARVERDPRLRPLYPDADLAAARERLTLFLIQYFGGPAEYAARRGHPRLRMRHAPFAIGPAERDAWLEHMEAAIQATPALAEVAPTLRGYFVDAAHFLQNRDESS